MSFGEMVRVGKQAEAVLVGYITQKHGEDVADRVSPFHGAG